MAVDVPPMAFIVSQGQTEKLWADYNHCSLGPIKKEFTMEDISQCDILTKSESAEECIQHQV